jgi:hypothetical protein
VIRVVEGLVLPEVVTGDLVSRFVRRAVRLGTWIFHTLVETALGMVYAIVRRVDAQLRLRGRSLGRRGEALLSVAILAVSIVTAQAGSRDPSSSWVRDDGVGVLRSLLRTVSQ